MKRVVYAGGSFLTTDELADAVLELTAALGRHGTADMVIVPTATGVEGSTIEIVIGPASQLTAITEDSSLPIPEPGEELAAIRARIASLGPVRPVIDGDSSASVVPDEYNEFPDTLP